MMERRYTLSELGSLIRGCLSRGLADRYWVMAEITSLQVRGGHCYLDLAQKGEVGNLPVARMRAVVWSRNWYQVEGRFRMMTGQTLSIGMKVLLSVTVQYHDAFGLSLIVQDVDPSYTMGDIAQRRQEILMRLEADGIRNMNRELDMPLLPQRIAVVSSPSAAGYQDFCKQLDDDSHRYYFETVLFQALMQGEHAERSVADALDRISARQDEFDVAVIIRGGGATSDLMAFDSYELASRVAQFPIPVITGIGHERDDTVIDMVSHTRVKTPTAAAQLLIARIDESGQRLERLERRMESLLPSILKSGSGHLEILCQRLGATVSRRISDSRRRLSQLSLSLPMSYSRLMQKEMSQIAKAESLARAESGRRLSASRQEVGMLESRLAVSLERMLERRKSYLALLAQRIEDGSPERILERGYSITLANGKAVRDPSCLSDGEEIRTLLAQGEVTSIVRK